MDSLLSFLFLFDFRKAKLVGDEKHRKVPRIKRGPHSGVSGQLGNLHRYASELVRQSTTCTGHDMQSAKQAIRTGHRRPLEVMPILGGCRQ